MIEITKDNEVFKIQHIEHMLHYTNIESVFLNGLLSHNEAYRKGLIKKDISMDEVQEIRRKKIVYGRSLHDYVSFYFRTLNSMLFKRKEIQEEILIILADADIINEPDTVFSDGNAANSPTKFYKGSNNLVNIPLQTILRERYWASVEDGKRIVCAEVLAYPTVSVDKIKYIVCPNQTMVDYVISFNNNPIIEKTTSHINVVIERGFYF
jgi:hypothetical protein